ncbi:MAG: hypothetical protein IT322_05190 [Anaerolineae bacterium]|nr:hypothetical protein [Anaerolineae bacterium]
MEGKTKVEVLREIIQQVADERPDFFNIKGEGVGNLDTNHFIAEVRQRAKGVFGEDFSERRIGNTASAVDFYFEDEAAIVEIALGLRLPNSEYEKDIFKALLAQETCPVKLWFWLENPVPLNNATNRAERRSGIGFLVITN